MPRKNEAEMRMYLDVEAFHEKFQLKPYDSFRDLPDDLVRFREKFLTEEALETYKATLSANPPEVLDGLIDLAYVALGTFYLAGGTLLGVANYRKLQPYEFGTLQVMRMSKGVRLEKDANNLTFMLDIAFGCRSMAQEMGWFFDTGWDRGQSANMSKVRAKREGDSKRGSTWDVVKPKGWVAPKMDDLV